MNYWYVARPNEIFIDTDNFARSMKHTKARLQGAIECGKLYVDHVMSQPSRNPKHIHTIITLKGWMHPAERALWAMILHSDIYRAACTLARMAHEVNAPDVLISPHKSFYLLDRKPERMSDDECDCVSKHTAAVMETCPAAKRLRGDKRTLTFFGKPSKNKCEVWP